MLFEEGTETKYEIGNTPQHNFLFEYRNDRWGYYAKDTHEEPYRNINNIKITFRYGSEGWGWYDNQNRLKQKEDPLLRQIKIPNVTPPQEPKNYIKPTPISQQDRQLLFLALLYNSDRMTNTIKSPSISDFNFPVYYPEENKLISNGNSFFEKYKELINNVIVDSLEYYKLNHFSRYIVDFLRKQHVSCKNITSS